MKLKSLALAALLSAAAILPAAAAAGVQWYIVEHDQPRDPAKVIKTGADYLRQHLTATPPASAAIVSLTIA